MGGFLKNMEWLGRARADAYLRILAFLNISILIFIVATSHRGIDRNGFLIGTDFISFWTTGHMLQQGGDVYDAAAHIARQRQFFATDSGYTAFFYPPSFLPICWPLGLFGYFPALAAWLITTGALYIAAVREWWLRAGEPAPLWLLVLAFPAVPLVITHGQTSFLVATLLGLGALLVRQRPDLAGVLFGLATIKPQFGPLIPLALMLTREWRTVFSAAATTILLMMLAVVLSGPGVWTEWLAASARAQAAMEAGGVPFGKMVSVFAGARLLGADVSFSYGLQVASAIGVGLGIGLLCRQHRWSAGLGAAVLAGALLVTPFALDYDLVLLAFPMLWLLGEGLRNGFREWEKLALALAFVAPAFARPLALNLSIPIMPAVLALLFAVIVLRATNPAPVHWQEHELQGTS
ncbi:glycosyltransferase family 87 protein [Novosphingobium malaysiense]|uniref:glycosyltransferase family 87 protein n=1 Tax=Novosphingobium malaysiense TaxID=1348853 RepID=UPI00068DD1F1|nr:glycosyltransferase family 87 protein [Novosphingobium malaysiense]